jgi:glycosyltransferase involved in cell wall biosynthesis
VLEAMACGTPVVATGTGGSGEYLEDRVNCLIVPPGNADALAAAVRTLAADPALRARVIAGGARTAADLTLDRLADTLEEWHVAAAARFASGRPAHRAPVRPDQLRAKRESESASI